MSPLLVRADLRTARPYDNRPFPSAGAPVAPLNNNESPFPPRGRHLEALRDAAAGALATTNRYPDTDLTALRTALARYVGHDVRPDMVWPGNGSNEVLLHLLLAYGGPGRTALGFGPTYSMHERIAAITGTRWAAGARGGDFGLDAETASAAVRAHRPHLVFLCAPNNPTGTPLDPATLDAVLSAAPGLVVLDEAYVEFSRLGSRAGMLSDHPRLVISRTMSKAFGFAGIRAGFLLAAPGVLEPLRLVALPYHLSTLTTAVALAALERSEELLAHVPGILAERRRVRDALVRAGHDVAPSDANFLFFDTGGDSTHVASRLAAHGVLVRDLGPAGWLRVTVGSPDENDAFLRTLADSSS
ncbi:histidinol-phosphate transaminase [Spongiactinospora sp. TRM90649]|uniref:histidinol-phosphate transaminase n=1 Tax=Spongiactinospora sp. TRM90649 TaxID=3031114 RepID=UPI0023F90312|nr:histidinol-phosphate transaminase [Spongiactinospora sp. TRM90649]MDF5751078.1 histidinol-phosphate transaminase [Spongiactinospora sp. TRM90649]